MQYFANISSENIYDRYVIKTTKAHLILLHNFVEHNFFCVLI